MPPTIICPSCASADVVYSCTPDCCFNHVCADCHASFQLSTEAASDASGVTPPPPGDDSCAATAACALCRAIVSFASTWSAPAGKFRCPVCAGVLTLVLEKLRAAGER